MFSSSPHPNDTDKNAVTALTEELSTVGSDVIGQLHFLFESVISKRDKLTEQSMREENCLRLDNELAARGVSFFSRCMFSFLIHFSSCP